MNCRDSAYGRTVSLGIRTVTLGLPSRNRSTVSPCCDRTLQGRPVGTSETLIERYLKRHGKS